ncbi:MAG: alpha/beta hydrolase [Acidobacteriota bacterium]
MSARYLIVPGITNSSEDHWQSRWEREFPRKFRRIEQSEWDKPVCSEWTAKIESEIQTAGPEDVVLVAHSLGCATVAHWAQHYGTKIKGALLVTPSDCETRKYKATFESTGFDPVPLKPLPFRSIVVASTNDEWVPFERAKHFADAWGSELVNVGAKGHINVGSGFGEWAEGLELLKRLD